jgi:hypothetical protein
MEDGEKDLLGPLPEVFLVLYIALSNNFPPLIKNGGEFVS